ncbi:MAG TPA: aldolase/citrate lyase family protein [Candidatus Saccharimonadales bacterium]|nr:aldolase/citrate lyase family protein [Candidatus Saccharimonadales bacterium]
MKIAAIQKLRQKLAADESVHGLWITLESASLSEMAVALGLDWIVVDAEHGYLDWREIFEHIRATVRSDTVVLVRLAELNAGLVKRALDIGADGVVIPWIETAAQLQQSVSFATFPPEGVRGIGADRATAWGQCFAQHTQEANEHVLVVPIVESVAGGKNIQALCQVAGVELVFVGPADYSSTAGFRGQWEGPGVAKEILAIKDTVRAHGKHCGIITTSHENLVERRLQGFRMLGLGTDCGLFLRGLHSALGVVKQDRLMSPTFIPEKSTLPLMPLPRPPESLRPNRWETMNEPGKNPPVELAPGVALDCLVGAHNGARNLTTGLVTFEPTAKLDYHTHLVSESITVLSGTAVVAVEGREYSLGMLDTIVIPRGLAHAAWNTSASERGVVHVALPTDSPVRELISTPFERRAMPEEALHMAGKERVIRFASAARSEAGPGTSFIDHFNKALMPGIEMSGGYGFFQPGGRLPAHFHDFDESICIIEGAAVCIVEGRRYQQSGCNTALQPRGRVHYFVNESKEPMAMIWVYAGPMPERIIVDECCATVEGNPWKEPLP